ncbi:hypothetical protein LWI29_036022 [Acer saccharum]|uniref:Transmembrane protein n=1 Tax=Acer saccharum TaxID=4024 RepID=A0AA39VY99_ACESA|nr:hypothetical protein LWI29_036022 [Acer saccharum]
MAFSKNSFLLLGLAFVVVLLISSHEKRVVITMVMTTDMEAAETTDIEAADTVVSSLNMVMDMEDMKDMENMEVADMAATLDTVN